MARVRAPGGGIQQVPVPDSTITDMALKESAIARTTPPGTQATRYKAPDNLLAFLDQL